MMNKMTIIRYLLLLCCLAGCFVVAVDRCRGDQANVEMSARVTTSLTLEFDTAEFGPLPVVVTIPKAASTKNPMPVLIALHGQGESRKSPKRGARGWPEDYGMIRAFSRLHAPPLTSDDFGGMVETERLCRLNRSLETNPFRGIIVISPYLPDRFRAKQLHREAEQYGRILVNQVLPKVHLETPSMRVSEATAIDGVSLGGRASVVAGLLHPKTFGAVGGIQAAFGKKQVAATVDLVKQARKINPKMKFRLMSSYKDRFLKVTRLMSHALHREGESHRLDVVKGNHSYEFNRGPGVYEMLLYYDRVLRGERFL